MSHALAVLTGKSPATFLAQLAKDSPIPQAQNNLALNFPAETLRQRPDVSAAEYRISAELARLELSLIHIFIHSSGTPNGAL